MVDVTITQAKEKLSELINRALSGEPVTILRGSTPIARLLPIEPEKPKGKREFGAMRGRVRVTEAFFEPLPDDELRLWEK